MSLRVLVVIGTRPEAIKMFPVIRALKNDSAIECLVCLTFQHQQLLMQVMDFFGINIDFELPLNSGGSHLTRSLAFMMQGVEEVVVKAQPDLLLVHGDTTSCLAGALAGFYRQIPIVHIEAGLRTHNLNAPFPEEAHRQMVSRIASLHLVPTIQAKEHLLAENITEHSVFVTGNTIVDSLFEVINHIKSYPDSYFVRQVAGQEIGQPELFIGRALENAIVLITLHRRELNGEKLRLLCEGIRQAAQTNPDRSFVLPVHLNPAVREPIKQILSGVSNIFLVPPQSYECFIWLMTKAELVVTDSGGVQEEAIILAKPLIIVRDKSDRGESSSQANVILIGTDSSQLVNGINHSLANKRCFDRGDINFELARPSVFGDGNAAQRVLDIIKRRYCVRNVNEREQLPTSTNY